MAALPQHIQPTTREDCIDTWKAAGRITLPNRSGKGMRTWLVAEWVECSQINGAPLDLRLEVQATLKHKTKPLGIVFADWRPESEYPIPVIWVNRGEINWLNE